VLHLAAVVKVHIYVNLTMYLLCEDSGYYRLYVASVEDVDNCNFCIGHHYGKL